MGEVLLCRDHTIGRDVAMKVIRRRAGAPSDNLARRFVREARVQGQLEHPSIVPVYDAGITPAGALYFTMKRVRGVSLAEVVRDLRAGEGQTEQRFSRRRLLSLFSQVCMAVHFGHQKGVVHRDLKPSNIMFGDFGEVYVLDWGLAGLRDDPATEAPERIDDGHGANTLATSMLGTPGYMAPEQVEPAHGVDSLADVYALGAILFELLSLSPMHERASAVEILASTLRTDGASPAARAPEREIPPELDRLCHGATRRTPSERVQSAELVSRGIEAYLDGDRDLSLRRELAGAHASRADEAYSRSRVEGAAEERERTNAMREVSAALGLDPAHQGARTTLVRLITEPPRDVPAEAREEIERNRLAVYRLVGKSAVLYYFGYLLYLPMLLWMGVRDWTLFAFGWVTIAACALVTLFSLRFPPKPIDVPLPHLIVSNFTVGSASVVFGPFVVVPMLAVGNAIAYMTSIGHRRGLVVVSAVSAVLVPHLLTWLGVLPNAYVFEGGTWTIVPTVLHLPPIPTQVFLGAVTLGTLLPACGLVYSLRVAYSRAEEALQLQAWQLRRIVPSE